MPKPSFYKNSSDSRGEKEVHNVRKGISPIVNVIARLEIELTYFEAAVHHFNHFTVSFSVECDPHFPTRENNINNPQYH